MKKWWLFKRNYGSGNPEGWLISIGTMDQNGMEYPKKPNRYKNVAQIGFSPPIIKKLNQNKYQILYALEDQIGLLEINLQN